MLATAKIFQSGMILQREKPVTVWGSGDAGKKVTVSVQGKEATGIVDELGMWKIVLPALVASTEETVVISCGEEVLTFTDVAVGEVWLVAGQSNAEFPMVYEKFYKKEQETMPSSQLRFYDVSEVCYEGHLQDFAYDKTDLWRKADGENMGYFSAIGYYMQKNLSIELGVPVGVIGLNWGGTRCCAWMKKETLKKVGPEWIELFEKETAGVDETFWKTLGSNPANDRTNPTGDAFCELFLPRTPGKEEIDAFFGRTGKEVDEEKENTPVVLPQTKPGCLYEHMVLAVAPYAVRGAAWYQGESDDAIGKKGLYRNMLSGMISDWREAWQDELPFLIVQLAPWTSWLECYNNHFYILRKEQQDACDTIKDVYLCSISDVGEEFDIHPKNKKAVGERLALLAIGHVYGKDILCDAPRMERAWREENQIFVSFAHAEGGLVLTGERLNAMEIYAKDHLVAFETRVEDNRIVLQLMDDVSEHTELILKFAQTKYYEVNLYNMAQIPAVPFAIEV